jgi:hypothetical protein
MARRFHAVAFVLGLCAACGSSDDGGGSSTKDAGQDVAADVAPDVGSIDCSLVGCGAPPMCSTGCTEVCGCCSCGDGETQGGLVCTGGCWAPADAGGD